MEMPMFKLERGETYDLLDLLSGIPYTSGSNDLREPGIYINVGVGEESQQLEILMIVGDMSRYYVCRPMFGIECRYIDIIQNDRFMPVMALQEEIDEYTVRVDQNGRIDGAHSVLTVPLGDRTGHHKISFIPNEVNEDVTERMIFPFWVSEIRMNPDITESAT